MKKAETIHSGFLDNGWRAIKRINNTDNLIPTEDIAQYEKAKTIIDVGFYGDESSDEGEYIIFIIRDQDWENYFAKFNCRAKQTMLNILEKLPEMI